MGRPKGSKNKPRLKHRVIKGKILGKMDCVAVSVNAKKEYDEVNFPAHYNQGKIEVIDYIEDKFADDYFLANVCKYISRAKFKGKEIEDLKKAAWYLDRKIKLLEKR
jgi:hypothetical protein